MNRAAIIVRKPRLRAILSALFVLCNFALGQFSPGELSRVHTQLEGSQNCVQCHEVGKEISGAKCLTCHREIQKPIEERRGFHFLSSAKTCVDCHKEHLGKNARTIRFEPNTFEHAQTGFALTGKHAALRCEQCHVAKNIRDPFIKTLLGEHPHDTYLGLQQMCGSCHADPHRGKFTQPCSTCHTPASWTAVVSFNHARTSFPLEGKHAQVQCSKCHQSLAVGKAGGEVNFGTKSFADCTPCHTSPHVSKFENRPCLSCHSPGGWEDAMRKPFDHALTEYKLTGRHALLRCEQCHRVIAGKSFQQTFLLAAARCTDCHADQHGGQFLAAYGNNCTACHSLSAYTPSTFTIAQHNRSRFPLTGSHPAVPCEACHRDKSTRKLTLRFSSLKCESCHPDVHKGSFGALMADESCAKCHTTNDWKQTGFDHSKTAFQLTGKHASAACESCHKEMPQFKKLATACRMCHADIHREQFAVDGKTNCASCHTPDGWKPVTFDHEIQSTFALTGTHKKLGCRSCHHEETKDGIVFVRFKPLEATCESCHQRRNNQE